MMMMLEVTPKDADHMRSVSFTIWWQRGEAKPQLRYVEITHFFRRF